MTQSRSTQIPGCRTPKATKNFTISSVIFAYSVWNLLHITRSFRRVLDFRKICVPLIYNVKKSAKGMAHSQLPQQQFSRHSSTKQIRLVLGCVKVTYCIITKI